MFIFGICIYQFLFSQCVVKCFADNFLVILLYVIACFFVSFFEKKLNIASVYFPSFLVKIGKMYNKEVWKYSSHTDRTDAC